MSYLGSNPCLKVHFELMVTFLFKMDLSESNRAPFHERPFEMKVYLQQEPADIAELFRLYRRESVRDTRGPILGMPQIVNVVGRTDISPRDMQSWEEEVREEESSTFLQHTVCHRNLTIQRYQYRQYWYCRIHPIHAQTSRW